MLSNCRMAVCDTRSLNTLEYMLKGPNHLSPVPPRKDSGSPTVIAALAVPGVLRTASRPWALRRPSGKAEVSEEDGQFNRRLCRVLAGDAAMIR